MTFERDGVTTFAPLLIYAGSDHAEDLQSLRDNDLTPFSGASVAARHIWDVFQSIIDRNAQRVFINGDWPFINRLFGLKSPTADYPCPICLIHRTQLTSSADYRDLAADDHSRHAHH